MKITGDNNVLSDYYSDYTVSFESELKAEKKLLVSIDKGGVAMFSYKDSVWSAFIEITCPKGVRSVTFRAFWTKEASNATLLVKDQSSGEQISLTVNIKVQGARLILSQPEFMIGTPYTCWCQYPNNVDERYEDVQVAWQFDSKYLKKTGDTGCYSTECLTIFNALRTGKTRIGVFITKIDHLNNITSSFCKGDIGVEIKHPYKILMDKKQNYAKVGDVLTYYIGGLVNSTDFPEAIRWIPCRNAEMLSEQGSARASFRVLADGEFPVQAVISTKYEEISIAESSVWVGVPSVDEVPERTQRIEAGKELIIQLDEFNHYEGNINCEVQGLGKESLAIERLSRHSFKVKSNHPLLTNDTLTLCFEASNPCGSSFSEYTLLVEGAAGSSMDKPLHLFTVQDSSTEFYTSFDMDKYVGDLLNFTIYFSFELKHKEDFSIISSATGEMGRLPFKIYNSDREEVYAFTPSGTTDLSVKEMSIGYYYWAVQVSRKILGEYLHVFVKGIVNGQSPSYPYVVDVAEGHFEFSDRRDTTLSCYEQNFRYNTSDGAEHRTIGRNVYYIMKLEKPMMILFHAAGSKRSTEIHIMQGTPYSWELFFHEIGSSLSREEIQADSDIPQSVKDTISLEHTCVKRILPPGEYRIVMNCIKRTNGGADNGVFSFNVVGTEVK